MADDWDGKGSQTPGKLEGLADRFGKMREQDRKALILMVAAALSSALWFGGLSPALKSYEAARTAFGKAEALRAEASAAAEPVEDVNKSARAEAKDLEAKAASAEAAAEAFIRSSGAPADLPAVIAKATGTELAGVASDGGSWPVPSDDGRWLHRIEVKVAAPDWESLAAAMKRAEAAAGPTAKALALDVGSMDDGRIAARAEWVVASPDRDWDGTRITAAASGEGLK